MVVTVCDPGAFPADYLDVRLCRHDSRGFSISFPCNWLLLPSGLVQPSGQLPTLVPNSKTPEAPLAALQTILRINLHDLDLNTAALADLRGLSKRTLNRRLSAMDTYLQLELANVRRKQAEDQLRNTDYSVAQVGRSVGYTDASVFARAF